MSITSLIEKLDNSLDYKVLIHLAELEDIRI